MIGNPYFKFLSEMKALQAIPGMKMTVITETNLNPPVFPPRWRIQHGRLRRLRWRPNEKMKLTDFNNFSHQNIKLFSNK